MPAAFGGKTGAGASRRIARPRPGGHTCPGAKEEEAPSAPWPVVLAPTAEAVITWVPEAVVHPSAAEAPVASQPEAASEAQAAWSPKEQHCVEDLLAALQRVHVLPPPEGMLLQVAWSRQLDAEAGAALWQQHLEAARCLDVSAVSDEDVKKAYSMGFCARAGKDIEGRPIIWVRLALCEVSKLTPSLAVRNAWLAHDATLCGSADANRRGICFVCDLSGVGRKNVTFNLRFLHAAIQGATAHPMHVSRVWLLDAPAVFLAAWSVGRYFLPQQLRKVVRFCSTGGARNGERAACLAPLCVPGELPAYMGGDTDRFGGDYAEWMFAQLQGRPLAYRREGSTFTSLNACVGARQLRAVQIH